MVQDFTSKQYGFSKFEFVLLDLNLWKMFCFCIASTSTKKVTKRTQSQWSKVKRLVFCCQAAHLVKPRFIGIAIPPQSAASVLICFGVRTHGFKYLENKGPKLHLGFKLLTFFGDVFINKKWDPNFHHHLNGSTGPTLSTQPLGVARLQ